MNLLTSEIKAEDPFAGLESDFDGAGDVPAKPIKEFGERTFANELTLGTGRTIAKLARFPCRKCGGSGIFRGVQFHVGHNKCFKCKGTGLTKTDPAQAAKRAEAAAKRREKKELERATKVGLAIAKWNEAHPTEAAWIVANLRTFDFAKSMAAALGQWGPLTDGQLCAVQRCIEKDAVRAKERAERKPDANVAGAGFSRMVAAFDAAKASGLKRPKFHVGEFAFAPAKATSNNAGCIYVTRSGLYLGRITAEGAYFATREATDADNAEVERIGADPLAAAVMHGKATGNCSCCGRHLENDESVALGIGPVCREKWGLK